MIADNMHVIKQGPNPFSYREVTPSSKMRHYIIGFASNILARKVQYTMAPTPSLRLYRSDYDDVSQQVSRGLMEFGVPALQSQLVLDTRAKLHISKSNPNLPSDHPLNDGNFYISQVPISDFLMYPFVENIGIIMPYDLDKEDDSELVFSTSVIEQTDSIDYFRSSLSKHS